MVRYGTRLMLMFALLVLQACSEQRKITGLMRESASAGLEVSDDRLAGEQFFSESPKDTLVVSDPDGRDVFLMKAVRDEDGEMVATDVLDAARVTARFRNVAERHGKVDLRFRIIVPESMMYSKWQLRFRPYLKIFDEISALDSVLVTGNGYRKAQLRGYQHYERFLNSIIADSTHFLRKRELEVFLRRNIPQLYEMKNRTDYVSEEEFASVYGVTQKEAVEHYTDRIGQELNRRRRARLPKMYSKYVKAPIVSEGIRLDTVMISDEGEFIYEYVQTIHTRPKLKRADIVLEGDIYEQDRKVYVMPQSSPLTFYISSLSSFADLSDRYLTKVVERNVEANTACYIEFAKGDDTVDETLGGNADEIGRIKSNVLSLVENREFDMDSVVVTANCSPEGSISYNRHLSERRGRSVGLFLERYMKACRDSIASESGFAVDEGGKVVREAAFQEVRFLTRSIAENWIMLDALVKQDQTLTDADREAYFMSATLTDPDVREHRMHDMACYRYMREHLYPRLRTVRFDFYLHRKGMVKDTVHTTVLDSNYMAGVHALSESDYERAVTVLRPYADFNTAVAYCAMDYNASALSVLEHLEQDARVNYMLAIVYSRLGDEENAVRHYLQSCRQNPSFVHRGNLDPEISALVQRYDITPDSF